MKSIKERKDAAKAYRKITSRRALGTWEVQCKRPVVEQLLLMQEKTRLKELIPIRRERMSVSPFNFFRGSAVIHAHDLGTTPGTCFQVQACGDAHISNYGIFASPERRLVFDINDFDETLPAPFEVDIKRLLASIEICGRQRNFSKEQRSEAVYAAAAFYRKTMIEFSDMGNLEVWYKHLDIENFLKEDKYLPDKNQMRQIKEAENSVLEAYYGSSVYQKCGQRVVEGQRAMQTAGDILLGWVTLKDPRGIMKDYYVRQLWDAKGSFDLETVSTDVYHGLSLACAWSLAHAHAKTGDRHAIAAYLGKGEAFDNAMVSYASAYADQNEADYEMFMNFATDSRLYSEQ